jgi:hypothetical protein
MTLRRKLNRSSNGSQSHHGASTTMSMSSSRSKEAIHVKNFMRSIDPSVHGRNHRNHHIPFSPPAVATSTKPPSLPFFPDPASFGTPSSLIRRNNNNNRSAQNKHCFSPSVATSISSAVSSPFSSPPSRMFYPSNRLRLKTNNVITVPCLHKTLFLSPTRAMARPTNSRNNGNGNGNGNGDCNDSSLLKEISHNMRSNVVPFQQDNTTKINNNMNKNHCISITNNTNRYRHFPDNPSGGLFEADSPVIGRKSFPFFLQTPTRSPESAMEMAMSMRTPTKALSTPPKRIGLFASTSRAKSATTTGTHAAAIVTNPLPWYASFTPTTTTTALTPKHVSIDTRNKSPMIFPGSDAKNTGITSENENCGGKVRQSIVPVPALRPQPSVGTTMAASALVSMMVMTVPQQGGNSNKSSSCNRKRDLGVMAVGSPSPFKKYRMSPPRISNFLHEAPSTSIERPKAIHTNEDGENCKSLSNFSGHGVHSLFHSKSNEKGSVRRCRKGSSRSKSKQQYASSKSRLKSAEAFAEKTTTIGSAAPSSTSVSTTSGPMKRIPRRFIDDPSLPVLKSGMRLAGPNDREELNSLHCFVRSELLEVFVLGDSKASDADSDETNEKNHNGSSDKDAGRTSNNNNNNKHREKSVRQIQRVGIRCIHCGNKPKCQRAGTSMSAFFPKSLQDIYRGVCTWQRIHFQDCKHIPQDLKELYKHLKDSDRSRGKKAHWVRSAHDMGFRNVDDFRNGIVWVGSSSTTTSTTTSPREGATPFGARVGRGDHETTPRASQRQVVTLDLTKFDEAIEAGAENNPGDEEDYNYVRTLRK